MEHSEFYLFANAYWWLIFPVGAGIVAVFRTWARHRRAQSALQVIKSYADQGKEPPAELMRILQAPDRGEKMPMERSRNSLMAGFVFAALATAFLVLAFARWRAGDEEAVMGIMFVVVMMAGFAVGSFIMSVVLASDQKRQDPP